MPYVFDPIDKENEEQLTGQPQMTGGGATFSGQSTGPSTATNQQQKGTNRQGSGFVGLDQYMAANRGNQFGNQFTGKVSDTLNNAKQTLNQGAQEFTQASNQGTTRWDDVGNEFKSTVDQAGKNTTEDQKKKVRDLQNVQYQGPQSFTGTATSNRITSGAQKAQQEARALQSEGGRFALLDQYFGRPSYSMGQKTLDNVLVQGTAGVPARSSALLNQANQFGEQAKSTSKNLENLVSANRQTTADTAKQATDYTRNALNSFSTDLNDRYKKFTDDANAYNQAMRDMASQIGTGQSPAVRGYNAADIYQTLGVGNESELYGLTGLDRYLTQADPVTLSEFTNPEEAARLRVLGELAGDFADPLNDEEIGRGGTGRIGADVQALGRDINSRRAEYENLLSEMPAAYQGVDTGGYFNSYNDWLNADPRLNRFNVANWSYERDRQTLDELNAIRRAYGQAPLSADLLLARGDNPNPGLLNPVSGWRSL